jgi:acetoacetyl-CoA synthetase
MSNPTSTTSRPPYIPQIRLYQDWLKAERGLEFASYDDLWKWSTTDLTAFWRSIWDYHGLHSPTPYSAVHTGTHMPDVQWFPGAQLNYAHQVLRHVDAAHAAGMPAIVSDDERGRVREMPWPELRRQVASLALALKDMGVERGDRVCAYMPNLPETAVALIACASIGAVWSICSPDMGTAAVLDRFRQIEPKVLLAVDGVHYGGKPMDRASVVDELREALPSLEQLVVLRTPYATGRLLNTRDFTVLTDRDDARTAAFEPEWLPFDHPLWVVYSSGTTGLPKPIVHGHGGILLTMLASKGLHNDVGASYEPNSWGERFHWYSSTGWVMWNAQVAGLAGGTTIVIYDGSPSGSKQAPDWALLWRFAARHGVTFFGAGAAYYTHCMKAGLSLHQLVAEGHTGLARIRALGTTGSPLAEDVQRWGLAQFAAIGRHDLWWCNISGGTDFCGAFIGGNRELPQVPGQMQCRQLGCAVEAWSEAGTPLLGEVGELVCTQPIPSMPLYFWGDENKRRYKASYFEGFPGREGLPPVWRHGDWLKIGPDGGCVIYGRSDATINRHGLRMGTSEIYSAVEALPEIIDSMVVDLEYLGRESFMPLFVVLRPGLELDDALLERIHAAIRTALSPRFLPDEVVQVAEIPRTLSGKKQELPIKKLLLGQPLEKVVNPDTMANPGCLAWYEHYAQARLASHHPPEA